ncbi:MAG: hypothetical protein JW745_04405, partial [Sedimentisphaerales bacterium]|nr:hypothetical protein [Sedimentisphaerales bacterium]
MYSLKTQKVMTQILYISIVLALLKNIAHYFYIYNASQNNQYVLFMHYIFTAVMGISAMVIGVLYLFGVSNDQRKFYLPEYKPLFIWWWAVIIISFIVGIVNNNDYYYLFGDLYRDLCGIVTVLLIYWVYCGLSRTGNFDRLITFIELMVVIGI